MMPTLSSLSAPEVAIKTASRAANDDKVDIITILRLTTSDDASDDKAGIIANLGLETTQCRPAATTKLVTKQLSGLR